MAAEAKYNREITTGQVVLEDVEEALESGEREEIEVAYERICEIIKKLEMSKTGPRKKCSRRKKQSIKYGNGTKGRRKRSKNFGARGKG